jgi:hypothetical protein
MDRGLWRMKARAGDQRGIVARKATAATPPARLATVRYELTRADESEDVCGKYLMIAASRPRLLTHRRNPAAEMRAAPNPTSSGLKSLAAATQKTKPEPALTSDVAVR